MLKKQIFIYSFSVFICAVILSACQFRPSGVMSEKKMEKVMHDIYIAEAIIENDYHSFRTPEQKEAFIKNVYDKHGITKAEWDSSLAYYSDNVSKYIKINDSVKARLQRERKNIETLKEQKLALENNLLNSGGINLWTSMQADSSGTRFPKVISLISPDYQYGFSFEKDSAWIAQNITDDTFEFSFDVLGICYLCDVFPVATIMKHYKDTSYYESRHIVHNTHYALTIDKYIPRDTLQSVSGFIHYANPKHSENIQFYDILLGNKKIESTTDLSEEKIETSK